MKKTTTTKLSNWPGKVIYLSKDDAFRTGLKPISSREFWVISKFGSEGWDISHRTRDWNDAVKHWKKNLCSGTSDVEILERIPLIVKDGR